MAKHFGNYSNGIPKRLCTNCPYKKVSFGRDSWCKLYNKGNSVLGIYEWYDFPHPKCPLATMTYNKLLKLAHYYKHKDGWAYYEAQKLGLAVPGLSDTQKQKSDNNIKEVSKMTQAQDTIKYMLNQIDTLFYAEDDWFEKLSEFVGTGVCDGYCGVANTDNCPTQCTLFAAMSTLKTEPTIENLDRVKALVSEAINKKFKI